jgi:hypothetical protein
VKMQTAPEALKEEAFPFASYWRVFLPLITNSASGNGCSFQGRKLPVWIATSRYHSCIHNAAGGVSLSRRKLCQISPNCRKTAIKVSMGQKVRRIVSSTVSSWNATC